MSKSGSPNKSGDQRHHKQDYRDPKEDPSSFHSSAGYATEPKKSRDKCYYEKDNRVVEKVSHFIQLPE